MVSDELLRDSESSYNMIEREKGRCFAIVQICQHSFSPFGKVINCDDDIPMALS
jgi:hypothetical protein